MSRRSAKAGRCCSSCRTSTTRVLDAELTAAHQEPSLRSGGRSACCRATTLSSAGRSVTLRSTGLEGELPFIYTDDPLNSIDDIVCTVVDNTLTTHGDKTRKMNPSFKARARPFPPIVRGRDQAQQRARDPQHWEAVYLCGGRHEEARA